MKMKHNIQNADELEGDMIYYWKGSAQRMVLSRENMMSKKVVWRLLLETKHYTVGEVRRISTKVR